MLSGVTQVLECHLDALVIELLIIRTKLIADRAIPVPPSARRCLPRGCQAARTVSMPGEQELTRFANGEPQVVIDRHHERSVYVVVAALATTRSVLA